MRPDDTLPLADDPPDDPSDLGTPEPPNGPRVSITRDGAALIVTLRGEFDAANSDAVPAIVTRELHDATSVHVDIADVTFLDSTLLRALLICQSKIVLAGVEFKVRNPSPQARRTFELTHLESLLE